MAVRGITEIKRNIRNRCLSIRERFQGRTQSEPCKMSVDRAPCMTPESSAQIKSGTICSRSNITQRQWVSKVLV